MFLSMINWSYQVVRSSDVLFSWLAAPRPVPRCDWITWFLHIRWQRRAARFHRELGEVGDHAARDPERHRNSKPPNAHYRLERGPGFDLNQCAVCLFMLD